MSLSEYIFSDGLIQTTTLLFHIICPRSDYIPILDHCIVFFVTETKCWSMLMKGFMRLIAGFAKVVGAIDGSLVPIITPINASVHPPQETIDRVDPPPPVKRRHVPSLFVRFSFLFVAFGQSVNFISNSNSDALHHAAVALSHTTLPNNSLLSTANSSKSSTHLHLITISAIIPNDNVDYVNVIHVFAEDTHAVYN